MDLRLKRTRHSRPTVLRRTSSRRIGVLGGTGCLGTALVRRWVMANHVLELASHDIGESTAVARALRNELGATNVSGTTIEKAAHSDIIVIALPFSAVDDVLPPLRKATAGKPVLSVINPMDFSGGTVTSVPVEAGSAAERCQELLPDASVVAAFHHVSHKALARKDLSADVIVCGDNPAAVSAIDALIAAVPGLRALRGGPLSNARGLEAFTPVLLSVNSYHGGRSSLTLNDAPTTGSSSVRYCRGAAMAG